MFILFPKKLAHNFQYFLSETWHIICFYWEFLAGRMFSMLPFQNLHNFDQSTKFIYVIVSFLYLTWFILGTTGGPSYASWYQHQFLFLESSLFASLLSPIHSSVIGCQAQVLPSTLLLVSHSALQSSLPHFTHTCLSWCSE